MITLDTNKIETSASALRYFDESSMLHQFGEFDGEVLNEKFSLQGGGVGFNYFEYNKKKDSIILQTSAKILGDDYLKGISINNIERVFDQVNRMGEGKFEIDATRAIDEGRFISIDTTDNVVVDRELMEYFEAFRAYRSSQKYKSEFYNQRGNQGITYKGNQTSFKERMIIYNKHIELSQKPDNAPFLKTLDNPMKLLNDSRKILRVEQNSVNLRKIRERLNVSSTSILGVLGSPMKPNYNLLMKIIKGAEQLEIFDDLDRFATFSDFEKYKGRESIIKESGYDLEVISTLMKHFYKDSTNFSRQMRQYRSLTFSILESERVVKGGHSGLVDEVLQLLKAS